MTKLQKIESEISELSQAEIDTLRQWFMEYDAEAWDRQIERDIQSGKLDRLAEEALADHRAGRSTEL